MASLATPVKTPDHKHPWARAISGWWVTLFLFCGVFAFVFDPPGFFPVYFVAAVVTMPVFVIATWIASGPTTPLNWWDGRR